MFARLSDHDPIQSATLIAGWLVLAVGVGFSVWLTAGIVWKLVDPGSADTPLQTGINTEATSTTGQRVDLPGLHLFGQSGLALPVGGTFDAPETSLDLLLRGTLASDDPEDGIAIVVDADGDGFYNVGDELPGSATLHEVYTDRVVLVHQGRYETLRLRDDKAPTPRNRQARRSRPRNAGTPVAGLPGIRSDGVAGTGNEVDWQKVQTSLRIDPNELARQVRVLPYLENGKAVGVRLQAGRDSAIFSRLGLRNTDIITEVNGIPLDNPARSFTLINQLKSQSQFAVRLKRDGRDMTLNIDANQLGN